MTYSEENKHIPVLESKFTFIQAIVDDPNKECKDYHGYNLCECSRVCSTCK